MANSMQKLNCSLNDTTVLRNLILENPELPLLVFCGEDAWSGDWSYEQADITHGEIASLTLYGDYWLDEDGLWDKLSDDLCDEEEYKNMPDEDYSAMIDAKVAATEFFKAIVVWAG